MLWSLRRVLAVSFFLSVLFVGVFSGNAFASQRPTHPTKAVASFAVAYYDLECGTYEENPATGLFYSNSGNASDCSSSEPGFLYEPFPNTNPTTAIWSIPPPDSINSCTIDAWFPYGDLSSDTRVRYDFWYGTGWLGWVGHDINQYSAPAGWNRIATNLAVGNWGQRLWVTAHDDGGSGNLAFAAMRFFCN